MPAPELLRVNPWTEVGCDAVGLVVGFVGEVDDVVDVGVCVVATED
jgi:hypothetical protein